MKKAILTLGLFSMMMILTSFTSPIGGQGAPRSGDDKGTGVGIFEIGGQGAPRSGDEKTGTGTTTSTSTNGVAYEIGGQGAPRSGDDKSNPGTGTGTGIEI